MSRHQPENGADSPSALDGWDPGESWRPAEPPRRPINWLALGAAVVVGILFWTIVIVAVLEAIR